MFLGFHMSVLSSWSLKSVAQKQRFVHVFSLECNSESICFLTKYLDNSNQLKELWELSRYILNKDFFLASVILYGPCFGDVEKLQYFCSPMESIAWWRSFCLCCVSWRYGSGRLPRSPLLVVSARTRVASATWYVCSCATSAAPRLHLTIRRRSCRHARCRVGASNCWRLTRRTSPCHRCILTRCALWMWRLSAPVNGTIRYWYAREIFK